MNARADAAAEIPTVIWTALGGLLIAAAAYTLRTRPRPGESPPPAGWSRVLDSGSALRTLGLGSFLSTVSLRNLAFLAAAADVIGQAALAFPELALTIAVCLGIGSLGILLPLLVRLFGGAGADARLGTWSAWLSRHMATMTAVMMILLGAYLVGKGIADTF